MSEHGEETVVEREEREERERREVEPLSTPPFEREGDDQEVSEGTDTETVVEGDAADAPEPSEGDAA